MKNITKVLIASSFALSANGYAMEDVNISEIKKSTTAVEIITATPQNGLLENNILRTPKTFNTKLSTWKDQATSRSVKNSSRNVGLGYSDDYVPLNCQQLRPNVSYSMANTTTGSSYCFYIPVKNILKPRVVAYINGQKVNNNHDLILLQDDPNSPGSFPRSRSSNRGLNSNEKVNIVSTSGHYYILITAQSSTGQSYNFGLQTYSKTDQQEPNGSITSATQLTEGQQITANIDSAFDDRDFYKYIAQNNRLVINWKRYPRFHKFVYSIDGGTSWNDLNAEYVNESLSNNLYEVGHGQILTTPGQEVILKVRPLNLYNPNRSYSFTVWNTESENDSKVSSLFGLVQWAVDGNGHLYDSPIPDYMYLYNSRVIGSVASLSGSNYFRIRSFVQLSNGKRAKFRKLTLTSTEFDASTGYKKDVYTNENGAFVVDIKMSTNCHNSIQKTLFIPGPEDNKVFKFDMSYYELSADTVNGYKSLVGYKYFYRMCSVRYQSGGYLNPFTFE